MGTEQTPLVLGAFMLGLGIMIYKFGIPKGNKAMTDRYQAIKDLKASSKNNSNESLVDSPNDWDNSSLSYGIE